MHVAAAPGEDHGGPAAGRVARRRPDLAVVVVAIAVAVADCGGIATSPAASAPPPGTATTAPSGTSPASATAAASRAPATTSATAIATATETVMPSTVFELTTSAVPAGGEIPRQFTCDGRDVSPDLSWSGAPDGTAALVLVVDDPDASGFVHWIVYDITGSDSGGLPRGVSASPDAPPQGTNDFGRVGWGGPCPPSGEHRYRFRLSALEAPLGLTGAPRGAAVRAALAKATVLATATLEGRYRRQ